MQLMFEGQFANPCLGFKRWKEIISSKKCLYSTEPVVWAVSLVKKFSYHLELDDAPNVVIFLQDTDTFRQAQPFSDHIKLWK